MWHEQFGWHDTGTHAGFLPSGGLIQPYEHYESAESKTRLASLIEVSGLLESLVRLSAVPATPADILRVHTPEHLERIQAESLLPRGGDAGDGQSPFGQGAYDIACLAAGGAIQAADAVVTGQVSNAYALIRPPGHHARPGTGMGFCIFANAAIAIQAARARHGIGRVAVVDWDVHHGNGTQEIFYNDPDTLTISIHQDNLFPRHSGLITEAGGQGAAGASLNIPLPAGSGNGAYLHAMATVIVPALRAFSPDLIVVASGFDASISDPLGRMLTTAAGYGQLTRALLDVAQDVCEGRVVMTHEGGYSPVYVPWCGLAVLQEMSGIRVEGLDPFEAVWADLPDLALQEWQRAAILAAAQAAAAQAAAALLATDPGPRGGPSPDTDPGAVGR